MTLSTSGSREDLWRLAAALQLSDDPRCLSRYQTLAAGGREDSWTFADVQTAPKWLAWPEGRRNYLVQLTGAVGVARAWCATIDGRPLQRAAEALGDDVLGRILALPSSGTPCLPKDPAESGEKAELLRLGGSLLLADLVDHPHLTRRIVRMLPGAPCPYPDVAQARLSVTTAFALMDELGPMQ
jgi:hypothetical protein